jgi:hypothetical protein
MLFDHTLHDIFADDGHPVIGHRFLGLEARIVKVLDFKDGVPAQASLGLVVGRDSPHNTKKKQQRNYLKKAGTDGA